MKCFMNYIPEVGTMKTFGPFNSVKEAKKQMEEDFNRCYKAAKNTKSNVYWNWSEMRFGACSIKGIGRWEIVKE